MNCAGVLRFEHSEQETSEGWLKLINVNLNGTFLMCRATLPYLLDGGGAIVNIASNAGLMGQPYTAAYCASKGGVVNLTEGAGGRVPEAGRARERGRARWDEHADGRRASRCPRTSA